MFMDISVLIENQGEMVNRIDAHVESAVEYTTRATNDTKKALEYQQKARRKKIMMLLCVIIGGGLGVVSRPCGVLHSTLHVSINPVDHLALILNQHRDIHEHLVKLLDGGLQLDEHLMPLLDIIESLSQLSRVSLDLDMTCQASSSTSLQHLLQLLVCGSFASNFQLPLDLVLGLFSVLHLDSVVLRHDLHEPLRSRHVLGLLHPQLVCHASTSLLLGIILLLHLLQFGPDAVGNLLDVRHVVV